MATVSKSFAIYNPNITADYIEPRSDWILIITFRTYHGRLQQYAPTHKNLSASFLGGSTNFLAIFFSLLFLSFLPFSSLPFLFFYCQPNPCHESVFFPLLISLSLLLSSSSLPVFPWRVTGYAAISHRIQIHRGSNNKSKRMQADVVI